MDFLNAGFLKLKSLLIASKFSTCSLRKTSFS
jgi:hypothetical protein